MGTPAVVHVSDFIPYTKLPHFEGQCILQTMLKINP